MRRLFLSSVIIFLLLETPVNSDAQQTCGGPIGVICPSCDDGNPCTIDICVLDSVCTGGYILRECRHIATCTWYLDADADGYYVASQVAASSPGGGWSQNSGSGGGDCNDSNPAIHPAAIEICGNDIDENCDGIVVISNAPSPTVDNLVATITNPIAKGCRGRILFSYTAQNCWTSYEATLWNTPDFSTVAEAFVVGSPQNNNLEFLSDGLGVKAGTYYIRLTDNTGAVLVKSITLTEPENYDENANVTYIIEPPNAEVCLSTLRAKLNTNDCFDEWFTILKAYHSDGTGGEPILFENVELEGHAKKGEEIIYQFVTNPAYSIFKLEFTHYKTQGSADNFIPETEITGIQPFLPCNQSESQLSIVQQPSTHCSNDGEITITANTTFQCFDQMSVHLKWYRSAPPSALEENRSTNFSNGRTITFSNLSAGNYEVVVGYGGPTIAFTCSHRKVFALTALSNTPLLSFTTTQQNPRCLSDANGSITAIVSGGIAPYTYLWKYEGSSQNLDGQGTKSIRGLSVGNYTLEVTDAAGCKINNEAGPTIILKPDNPPMIITKSQTDVTIVNGNNGTASAAVTAGTGPYLFKWNTQPPQTTSNSTSSTISGLFAGRYTLIVRDRRGCEQRETYIITGPEQTTRTVNHNSLPISENVKDITAFFHKDYKDELITKDKSYLFPNPANQQVNIQLAGDLATGKISIRFIDQSGRLIKQMSYTRTGRQQSILVNTEGFINGLYNVLITDSKRIATSHKLMIHH